MMIQAFTAPIVWLQSRLEEPPRWSQAIAPGLAFVALACVTAVVTTRKAYDAVTPALMAAGVPAGPSLALDIVAVAATVLGVLTLYALTIGAVLLLDVVFAQSGRGRRLVECAALAYVVQLPWAVVMVGIALWAFEPEPVRIPYGGLSQLDVAPIVARYQRELAHTPLQLTVNLVTAFCGLWVIALQACALRVVSGFSVRGAGAAAVTLGTVFVIAPWAWQRFFAG